MSTPSTLIFSTDALAAALIGAAAELAGYTPVFPNEDESARDALLRVRPALALVDCDHDDACADAFFGPALMLGTRVAVFSSTRSRRSLAPIAEKFGVRTFGLPMEFAELSEIIRGS
jgi:hypothetical protein